MLFESSEEAPGQSGPRPFCRRGEKILGRSSGLKIPQIGWNTVTLRQPGAPLLEGIANGDFVYFVHSYFVQPADPSLVALEATYGQPFAAAIVRGNLIATQFHPEKSQRAGLQIIRNFAQLVETARLAATAPA